MPGRATHTLIGLALALALTLSPEQVQGGVTNSLASMLLTYAIVSAAGGGLEGLPMGVAGAGLVWLCSAYSPAPWLTEALKRFKIGGEALLILTVTACWTGSRLPDADLHSNHRVRLHNLAAAASAPLLFLALLVGLNIYAGLTLNTELAFKLSEALLLSYCSHLAVDMLTPTGVALLHPLSGERFKIHVRGLSKLVGLAAFTAALILAYNHWYTSPIVRRLVKLLVEYARL